MKYGFFDDTAKEYVITDPKTPYPWINWRTWRSWSAQSIYSPWSSFASGTLWMT
jgi:hypothetical protein